MYNPPPEQLFADPPTNFGPTPLWWWSGDTITDERITWQLDRFRDGGVHDLVIINLAPRGPLFGAPADNPAWFSEAWWELFTHTCDEAAVRKMRIWFYDQLGFSGANIPGSLTRDNPWAAGEKLVATPLLDPNSASIAVEHFVGAYDLEGGRYAYEDLAELRRRGVAATVVSRHRTSFDYLNPEATALLFDQVHDEFERRVPQHLGTTIPGSFQDELPPVNGWTPELPNRFADRFGYDLLAEFAALFVPGDDRAAKIRSDYAAIRTQMAEEAFFRPLGQWHTDRGMLIGADQSHPARSGWPTQASQLYGDYFRTHRWYNAVGSDHNGDAKVHSSMAHLYRHDRVWMESFHSSGWGGTLEETWDWLIPFVLAGADLYNPHASYFSTFGGWFEWAPPSTDWRQPYWSQYPQFAKAVARLCSVANWGGYATSTAVLHPASMTQALVTADVVADTSGENLGLLGSPFEAVDQAQETYLALCGEGNWFDPKPGALDAAGIPFDVIDDASVQRATVDRGGLSVTEELYRCVVLPGVSVIEPGTAEALIRLLDSEGTVIVIGDVPRIVTGLDGDDTLATRLTSHPRLQRRDTVEEVVALVADLDESPRSDVPILVKQSGTDRVALLPAAWPSATEHLEGVGLRTVKDYNRSCYAARRVLTVPGPVSGVEIWDPATGERRPVTVREESGSGVIDVDLDGAPVVFVRWRAEDEPSDAATPGSAAAVDHDSATIEVTDWQGALLPTLDNRWGDFARPVGAELVDPQLWELEWAEGEDLPSDQDWQPVRVTFGQHAVTLGPVDAATVPAPLSADRISGVLDGSQALGGDGWQVHQWSGSRGLEREMGSLGNKSLIAEEFVRTEAPRVDGTVVVVRALVSSEPGPAELIVGSGAAKQVWWNGEPVQVADGGYTSSGTVQVKPGTNVLEYRLSEPRNLDWRGIRPELGSYFTLASPGAFVRPPKFVTTTPATGLTPLRYHVDFTVEEPLSSADLIVGSHATVAVILDGEPVAVQARTELYEDRAGTAPRYYTHDVTSLLAPGEHTLVLDLAATPGAEYIYADLALRSDSGVSVVTSDESWTVTGPDGPAPVQVLVGQWSETASARAARRPHPLPEASWMRGPAEVGSDVLSLQSSDDPIPQPQWYRLRLPAGSVRVKVPLVGEWQVRLEAAYHIAGDELLLESPLAEPTSVMFALPARAFGRRGAAWSGPVVVGVETAPIRLGEWREIGLDAWSGGVAYSATVHTAGAAGPWQLDLGDLRGVVEVLVNGERVGGRFCPPYRFELGRQEDRFELTVRLFNTLGPFLHESTPTMWVGKGQLSSGLFGPVTLRESPRV